MHQIIYTPGYVHAVTTHGHTYIVNDGKFTAPPPKKGVSREFGNNGSSIHRENFSRVPQSTQSDSQLLYYHCRLGELHFISPITLHHCYTISASGRIATFMPRASWASLLDLVKNTWMLTLMVCRSSTFLVADDRMILLNC